MKIGTMSCHVHSCIPSTRNSAWHIVNYQTTFVEWMSLWIRMDSVITQNLGTQVFTFILLCFLSKCNQDNFLSCILLIKCLPASWHIWPPVNWNLLRRNCFPWLPFYVTLFLPGILLLEKGVCGCWALGHWFLGFLFIRKQALVHLVGIKQIQKLTKFILLWFSSDTSCNTT